MFILGIESSCDDTSCAVIKNGVLLSNITASQAIHSKYGGVVPELAGRNHQKNIVPVVNAAIHEAKISLNQISAIAFTRGPGLMGSLLVGISFAKSLALALNIPLIEVNHMQAHIMAHFIKKADYKTNDKGIIIEEKAAIKQRFPEFPFLCLTVSGGHTQIVKVNKHFEFKVLGETMDDAVGEAFDKAAKILGLPYPGGPLIDKYAKQGNPTRFVFPKTKSENLNYSFSGIKTAFLYFVQKEQKENADFIKENLNDICASYQNHLIKLLLHNLTKASEQEGINEIAIAGGVSANSELRKQLNELGIKNKWNIYIPDFEFCTDNAAMIAISGHYKYLKNDFCGLNTGPLSRYEV